MINVTVTGLEALLARFGDMPSKIKSALRIAASNAGGVITKTPGLKLYPPSTAANAPPTPYYIRGRGTQLKSRNLYNSERLGSHWYIRGDGLKIIIGNDATYAPYVHGDKQPAHMAAKGWRKLVDVAHERKAEIAAEFDRVITSIVLRRK